jgi:hypothetical protein
VRRWRAKAILAGGVVSALLMAATSGGQQVEEIPEKMVVDTASGLGRVISSYGGWGLSAVLMIVIYFLFKKYDAVRDKKDAERDAEGKTNLALVQENTRAYVQLNSTLVNLTDAIKSLDRRMENVEDKVG